MSLFSLALLLYFFKLSAQGFTLDNEHVIHSKTFLHDKNIYLIIIKWFVTCVTFWFYNVFFIVVLVTCLYHVVARSNRTAKLKSSVHKYIKRVTNVSPLHLMHFY